LTKKTFPLFRLQFDEWSRKSFSATNFFAAQSYEPNLLYKVFRQKSLSIFAKKKKDCPCGQSGLDLCFTCGLFEVETQPYLIALALEADIVKFTLVQARIFASNLPHQLANGLQQVAGLVAQRQAIIEAAPY
jgi:hypothetical protein